MSFDHRFRECLPLLLAFLLASLFVAGSVLAQSPVSMGGGIGFSTTSYKKEVTDASNLVDRGFGFQGAFAPRFYEHFGLLAEIGWEYLGQVCLDNSCQSDKTSTSSLYASLGAGLLSPVVNVDDGQQSVGFGFTLYGGMQWVNAGLSENNCVNCTIDDLDVNGGLYIEPGIDIHTGSEVAIGFAYRIYESSADLNSRFTLRASYTGD
jgi:hypothetical protein